MSLSTKLLILLALLAAAFGAGVHWEGERKDQAFRLAQLRTERQAAKDFKAEVDRSQVAAGRYLAEHRDQEQRYEDLDDAFKAYRQRHPLVVMARVAPPCTAASAGAGAAPPADREAAAPGRIELPDGLQPVLTLGAVWMWNSALTGTDTPAGACGSAAATGDAEGPCAQESGLSLDDAWNNHIANARSCARDRQRLNHLIEYIEGRKK